MQLDVVHLLLGQGMEGVGAESLGALAVAGFEVDLAHGSAS
jgi:hypothetical protein